MHFRLLEMFLIEFYSTFYKYLEPAENEQFHVKIWNRRGGKNKVKQKHNL